MNNWQKNFPDIRPKYKAVEQMIINMIQQGFLSVETKLPSERNLAQYLNVDRSTISRAFDDLESNNIITRKAGSGSFISNYLESMNNNDQVNWQVYLEQQRFKADMMVRQRMNELINSQDNRVVNVYSSDLPDDMMPQFDFPALSWQDFIDARDKMLSNGYQPLLIAIKELYKSNSNLKINVDQMLITGGVKQALFLILQGLLSAGDAVITETPSFFYSSSLFKGSGVNVYIATMDTEGIDINILEQQIRKHKAKLVILNPNFQNPTGRVMSLKRRKEVVALCRKYALPIVEDDVFGWLNFDNETLPTLKELDSENVIYVSSLSKILGENTRIGWLIATPQIVQHLSKIQIELDMTDGIFPQTMAHLMVKDSRFQEQLNSLRLRLKSISEITYHTISKNFPKWQVEKPKGGYYLWITNVNTINLISKLIDNKLAIAPGILYGKNEKSLRINFAKLNSNNLPLLISKLRKL